MRLLTFLEAIDDDNKLGGGAGVMIYVPSTGRVLIQQRGEHPDDKDSGKYDFFGGTLEEGETAEECARREAKEEGQIEFPEGALEEIGAFSSTDGGDWDGEPYHVYFFSATNEFRPKIQAEEVAKAGWIHPSELNDQNSTNRVVKALAHEKVRNLLRVDPEEATDENPTVAESRLDEKTFNIGKDVDLIFDRFYAPIFDKVVKGKYNTYEKFPKTQKMSSEELVSGPAKKAHAEKPIEIRLAYFDPETAMWGIGSGYTPSGEHIYIFLDKETYDAMRENHGVPLEKALARVPEEQRERLRGNLTGDAVKNAIWHEMTHWVDDALHGKHISRRFKDIEKKKKEMPQSAASRAKLTKLQKGRYEDEYLIPREVFAQIHQIKELKRRYGRVWNKLSFENMLELDNTFHSRIAKFKKTPEIYQKWKRALLSLMAREGLLGASMKGAPIGEAAYPYYDYQFQGDWYHGMASSSRAFVRRKGSHPSNIGIWLTQNKEVAAQFAQQASRRMVDDEPIVVTAEVRAAAPFVFDTYQDYLDMWKQYGDAEKMRRSLMRKGHDSIIIAQSTTDFETTRMDIAVFKPTDLRVLEKEKL